MWSVRPVCHTTVASSRRRHPAMGHGALAAVGGGGEGAGATPLPPPSRPLRGGHAGDVRHREGVGQLPQDQPEAAVWRRDAHGMSASKRLFVWDHCSFNPDYIMTRWRFSKYCKDVRRLKKMKNHSRATKYFIIWPSWVRSNQRYHVSTVATNQV